MSRHFFDQVDDELRGFLGPGLRSYTSVRTGWLIKLWFERPEFHFEAQALSKRWGPGGKPALEVGLHLEAKTKDLNEEVLAVLTKNKAKWAKKLKSAEVGPAFGPQSRSWRRVSEIVVGSPALDDPDLADEVAERLALYVRTLHPLIA